MAECDIAHARWRQAEFIVDAAIHAAALTAALIGAVILITVVAQGSVTEFVASLAYVIGLLAMLASSALYNWGRFGPRREALHRLDQSAIFLMIAGSYTPFTAVHLAGFWSVSLTALVWAIAASGVLLRMFAPQSFERVYLVFYVGLGWIGLVALKPLSDALPGPIVLMLLLGGGLYTVGVTFLVWERLPFQNAIWHGFVVAAAAVHFAAVVLSL